MKNESPAFSQLAWKDIIGLLPEARIIEALADKEPGKVDPAAWDAVFALAQQRAANAFGAGKVPEWYAVGVRYALRVFAAYILFTRRGFHSDETNPFATQARDQEKFLRSIAEEDRNSEGGGVAITEPAMFSIPGVMA